MIFCSEHIFANDHHSGSNCRKLFGADSIPSSVANKTLHWYSESNAYLSVTSLSSTLHFVVLIFTLMSRVLHCIPEERYPGMPAQLMLPYFERLQTKCFPPKTKSMLCMVRIQNGFVRKHVMFQTYLSPLDRNVQNVIFPGVTACFVFVTPTQTLKFKNKLTSLWWDFYSIFE